MARNNRNTYRRHQPSTGSSLAGVWLLIGILLGVGIMGMAYIFYNPAHSQHFKMGQSNSIGHHPLTTGNTKETTTRKAAAQKMQSKDPGAEDPRFEFYTMLPGMELELNDNPHKPVPKKTYSTQQAVVHNNRTMKEPPVMNEPSAKGNDATPSPKAKEEKLKNQETTANALKLPHPKETLALKPKHSHYIVQAGLFQMLKEADALKARLTLQGFAPQIQKVQTQDGQAWFRVTLGPFGSETLAMNQKKRLEEQNVHSILILQKPSE